LAIDLRLEAWGSLSPLGQYARLLDHLRTAETLAIELGDQGRLAWVLAQLCQSLRMRRDIDGAIETGQRALAIASAIEDLDLQAAARYHLAEAYDSINDYRRARDLLNWIVDALNRGVVLQDPGPHEAGWLRLRARTSLTMTLSLLGHFTEGALHGEQAVRIADSEDRPFSRIVAQTSLGYLYLNKGDLHRAIPLLEESLALHRTRHISGWLRGTAATLGFAYTLSGRTAEGLPLLEEALAVDIAEGGSPDPVRVRQLGHAYLLIGRLDEALERAQYALTLFREQKRPGEAAWALHLLGEIAVRREHPDIETAEAHYQRALALATELGMRPLVAHCHLGLGKLYCRTGDRAKAEEHLTTATTMYREMDMRFWLAQAEAELRPLG
jgi:tetratricopeptide (TPR) repeat protein